MKERYETYDPEDAICECDHFQSVHTFRVDDPYRIAGHGPCPYCNCERFRWAAPAHPRWRKKAEA